MFSFYFLELQCFWLLLLLLLLWTAHATWLNFRMHSKYEMLIHPNHTLLLLFRSSLDMIMLFFIPCCFVKNYYLVDSSYTYIDWLTDWLFCWLLIHNVLFSHFVKADKPSDREHRNVRHRVILITCIWVSKKALFDGNKFGSFAFHAY